MDTNYVNYYKNTLEKLILNCQKDEEISKVINEKRNDFDQARDIILDAVVNRKYNMVYQPHIEGNKCVGAEALFRLNIDGIFFNPFVVFGIAHFYGFEEQLTLDALESVCSKIGDFREIISKDFLVTYNVNPTLISKDFCHNLLKILSDYGVANSNIAIELTEVSQLDDDNIQILEDLRGQGIKIFCDDFGTGYTSVENIEKIPFDVIKLAGNVVSGVDNDSKKKDTLAKMCQALKAINKKILAENVETKEEYETLLGFGVEEFQGYYFDKGMNSDELINKYSFKNGELSQSNNEDIMSNFRNRNKKQDLNTIML